MPALVYSAETSDLVARLRRVLLSVDLDCSCRARLEGALNRFSSLEQRRMMRSALAAARGDKDQIIARLAFLAELDEVTEFESDPSVFTEMALIFDEIASAAADAATAIRSVRSAARRSKRLDDTATVRG